MKKFPTLLLALLGSAYSAAACAAPGEWWEISSKVEMPGMPFAMPATTIRVCVARDAAQGGNAQRQTMQDKTCKMTDVKTAGNKTSWKMRCDRNGEVMNGSGEITSTPDSYQGVTRMKGTTGGTAVNMTTTYRGKRVGPACDAPQSN